MSKIIACCLTVLVAAMAMGLWQLRMHNGTLSATLSTQKKALGSVTAERDNLRDTPTPVCTPDSPPQSDVQAVLEPRGSEADSKIDALKKRYEDILVTYFVLKKCGRNDMLDYHIINSAMSQEMASLNAPGRLQYDILTAASGSYKELYSGNKCKASIIDPLLTQYQTFVDNVAVQFLPR